MCRDVREVRRDVREVRRHLSRCTESFRGFCFPIHTISKTQLDLDCYLLYDLSKHNKGIGMCHCLIKELIDGLRCVLCRFGFLFCVFFSDVIMVQSIDRV